MLSASTLFTYLFCMERKYDVTVTFMTLMSCDSVCCMRGKALEQSLIDDAVDQWRSCLRACVCGGHFEHTL